MRPLLISDCDEVLLHMVRHFGVWLDEAHAIDFDLGAGDFANSMTRRDGGPAVTREEMWALLGGFFPDQMDRQTLVPHAADALAAIAKVADIVILTNLGDHCREYAPSVTVFVDDLAMHHDSVARHAPQVYRLHMISEPDLARHVPKAPAAHARIDDWRTAQAWITDRFAAGVPAETLAKA